jgi:hypothetical protein
MSERPPGGWFKTNTRVSINKGNIMAKVKFRTPEQVFKKWVKELRSGKYEQAQGCLRDADYEFEGDDVRVTKVHGFCCLGVLCDIAVKDGGPVWDVDNGILVSDDGEPPVAIRNYLGLTAEMVAHLIEMNDDHNASFEEIADEIESNIMPALGMM